MSGLRPRSRLPRRWRGRSGLSLLEVVLATIILALTMLPIASVIGSGIKSTAKDYRTIEAIQLLERTANLLLQEPYGAIPVGNGLTAWAPVAPFPNNPAIRLGSVSGRDTTFSVTLTSSEMAATSFTVRPISVSRPGFDELNPQAADFLAAYTYNIPQAVKTLVVNVAWTEAHGVARSVQAVTFRANLNRNGT